MKSNAQQPPVEDSELVLEEIFRHTPIGVVLSDLHGTILDVNESLCVMVGYQRAELVGEQIRTLVHPDEIPDMVRRTTDLREGRTGNYSARRRYRTRDGEEVHVKVSVSVVYSKDREPICAIGFIENINEAVAMEAALRRSEMRYRRIVEDQTELIVRCLPDGTRTFVNEAYCRYNDTTASQLLGVSFFSCMDDEEQKLVRAKFASLTPEHPVITDQHWVRDPRGEMRWHEWTDRGFFDASGQLVEIQSVGRDLTEEHAAHEQVARQEERYRRLFNSLPIAAWENDWSAMMAELRRRRLHRPGALEAALRESPRLFYELGQFVNIVGVNAAALEMAGVNDIHEFRDWLGKAWLPESALRYGLALPRLISGELKSITDEFTMVRANGEPLDVLFRVSRSERWGEEWMMFPVAVDITDRKRAQRELVHKQELSERAEGAAHFGSWEWIPATDNIYGSAEFWRILDGVDAGGAHERPASECLAVLHSQDDVAASTFWASLRNPSTKARRPVIETEYRVKRADGSMTIASGQTFATYGDDGRMTRAFGILRDITAAKRAEEEMARNRDELVRADKMISLGILVSGMAHEINNPNHSIGLNVPLLRDAWRDAAMLLDDIAATQSDLRIGRMPWREAREEVTAMLDDIEHASDRIRNIVTELRGFALDHDAGERRSISVNEIVHASMRLLGKHIARATKRFTMALAPDVPMISGNASRIEQVVVNLVINACQALRNSDEGIVITTGSDAQRVFIRVKDEGRGIAEEHLPNIRAPFFTTKRAEGGTGLGLAVSDRIAGEHGGELAFESTPGHGTIATLWLPRVRA